MIRDFETKDQWLDSRAQFLGASESAAVLGCGYASQNALTVFASKVNPKEARIDATNSMVIGSLIEPGLIKVFEHFAERPAQLERPYRVRICDQYPFMGATLDAVALDSESVIPIELKNVDSRLFTQWDDEEIPLKFQIQCQHQMLCAGATEAFIMGLIGGNKPVIKHLARNEAFIAAMVPRLQEFWSWVERKIIPPDFDEWGTDATGAALKTLHPLDNGITTLLPEEAEVLLDRLELAKEKVSEWEKVRDACKQQLQAGLGDNTFGALPDGRSVSWKTQDRAGYTVAPGQSRVFRVHKSKG